MKIYSIPPTQPQRWKTPYLFVWEKTQLKPPYFQTLWFSKNKNTKGLYVTSRISTHDLLEDRNNHWQGLQRNLCFLLKFRQPCLLSAKIWTTSCVIIYKIVQKCANFIFAALSGTFKLVINFLVKNMRKEIKKISLEMKRALKWVSFWVFFFFCETLPYYQFVKIVPDPTSNCVIFIRKCLKILKSVPILAFLKIHPKIRSMVCPLSVWYFLDWKKLSSAIIERINSNLESTYIILILNEHMHFTNVDTVD